MRFFLLALTLSTVMVLGAVRNAPAASNCTGSTPAVTAACHAVGRKAAQIKTAHQSARWHVVCTPVSSRRTNCSFTLDLKPPTTHCTGVVVVRGTSTDWRRLRTSIPSMGCVA